MTSTRSEWNPTTGILRTELKGLITTEDVEVWRDGLYRELSKIPEGAQFRLLLDLVGFEPAGLDAHKAMRTVVPEILANHGLRPAFIDLFDERPEMPVSTSRGIRCVAFANVHHDETKMADYERRIGKSNQKFFTNSSEAEQWLREEMSSPEPNPRTARLFEHLDHHRANLRTAVAEIPPELRSRRSAPERWSVIELLEHLVLVERRLTYLFNQWLAEAREQELPPEDETDTGSAVNLEVVLNRNYLVTASEAVRPQGKLDEAAAWAALEEARRDLKATVLSAEGLPMGRFSRPHPALGPLNFYHWVEFVGWHEARHTAQIRENGSLLTRLT